MGFCFLVREGINSLMPNAVLDLNSPEGRRLFFDAMWAVIKEDVRAEIKAGVREAVLSLGRSSTALAVVPDVNDATMK